LQYLTTCPFPVATLLWAARPGALTLTVCVKITYALVHEGEARVAEEQDAVDGPRTWADDPRASLRLPGDFAPIKRRVDVLVAGQAFAPPARGAVESLVARYRIGELGKAVRVTGDRVWVPAGGALWPSAPAPFVSMPLAWERAAKTLENPVGVDPRRPPVPGALALPNLEPVDAEPGVTRAAGLGPVAPDWPSRRALVGADAAPFARAFHAGAVVREPMPRGFDFRFFNAAPPDQQVDALRATATIVLEHLHPRHARLVTRLPPVRPRVTHEAYGRRTEIGLRCDTLVLDTDRGLAIVSWRGSTELATADPRDAGRLVVGAEQNGEPSRFPGFEAGVARDEIVGPPPPLDPPRPTLGSAPRFGPPPPRPGPPSAPRPSYADRPRLDAPALEAEDSTLAIARPAAATSADDDAPLGTSTAIARPPREALPFAETPAPATSPPAETPPPSPRPPRPDDERSERTHEIRPADLIRAPVPFARGPGPIEEAAPAAPAASPAPVAAPAPVAPPELLRPIPSIEDEPTPPPRDREPAPEPPPMIGPIPLTNAPDAAPIAPEPEPAPIAEEAPGREDLGLEELARLRARLAERGADRRAVLAAERVTEASMRAVEARWDAALAAEAKRGRARLLARHDDAYVGEQEALRGPLGPEGYARLAVAIELGDLDPTLAELGLERADVLRLVRVWTRRTLADADLAAAVRRAIEAARPA
jgi:hypothetical protein